MDNKPLVSVIIPFRNEEKYIAGCIESLMNNGYPKEKLELLLIDGLSTDKSAGIIKSYTEKYSFIKYIINQKRVFPAAVNIGYNNSKGDIIMIVGAHAMYNTGYISKNVQNVYLYNADNTGGILNTIAMNESFTGKIISMVLSSSFGVGNATFRTGSDKITETDTVFGGCYKRSVFEKIGLFNENLVSTSDMDFNTRLKKKGGRIILDPSVQAMYYTRSTFARFIKNNFRNGFWAVYPLRYTKYIPVRLRHLVPLIFVSALTGCFALSFLSVTFFYLFLGILGIYLATSLFFSFKHISKGIHFSLFIPLFFFMLHFAYGIGSVCALFVVAVTYPFTNKT
ncbi:MAG: glycosyltransferase family 2 protein [Bacteroidia bacterium]|nr:glycosyltransferase family 2 protein [Bacteroidia bacterium]